MTIHAPTDRWQHLPHTVSPKHGYWLGPFATEDEAQDEAQEVAEEHDYDVLRCRQCFRGTKAPTESQKRARERRARSDWMPGIGAQPSRGGIANSRRR